MDNPLAIIQELLRQAIAEHRVVRMDYFSSSTGEFTQRTIEPIGLLPAQQLVAYCRMRQDYRTFRLDRMSKVQISEETFSAEDRLTVAEYIRR